MNCGNCGKKICYGDKYIPAYEHNLWFVTEHPKNGHIERELIKVEAICWDCIEEISRDNE